jgi:hypothetical protein
MVIREIAIETAISNLRKVAVGAGFTPRMGLYDGRMGTIIILYTGSDYFNLPDIEAIADNLLEDLLEDIQCNRDFGFSNGLAGIGWGINYLIKNKFIEADSDFFKDIDDLFSDKLSIDVVSLEEYLLSGLYLYSRFESNSNDDCLNYSLIKYFNEIIEIIKQRKGLLAPYSWFLPFWYCLGNMNIDLLTDEPLKQFINANDPHTIIKKGLKERYPIPSTAQNQEIPFTTIKQYYFDWMFYEKNLPDLPEELINNSFRSILQDERLSLSLSQTLNPLNLGLSQSFSGYVWSLLQYNKLLTLNN